MCAGPQLVVPSSRAASLHSASSTDAMLAEGFLDTHHSGSDVEAGGGGVQPLITPSGMAAEMRCVELFCISCRSPALSTIAVPTSHQLLAHMPGLFGLLWGVGCQPH